MGVYEPAYKARCMAGREFWVTHNCSYVGWCIVGIFEINFETIVSISQ